jgi:hypothetical protein
MREISYTDHQYGVKLPLDQLREDLDVQRAKIPGRITKLQKNWQDALCGELLVFGPYHDESGTYYLVGDGGHRRAVKTALGHVNAECEVFSGVSKEDQALVFLGRNDRAGIASADRNRNLATFNDDDTLNISRAALSAGFVFIASSRAEITFNDRAAGLVIMMDASRKGLDGPAHLAKCFELYATLFGTEDMVNAGVLKAFSKLVSKVEELDNAWLVTKLAGLPVQVVAANGETYRDKLRGDGIAISQVRATSRYLATIYDQGRPVKQRVAHRL